MTGQDISVVIERIEHIKDDIDDVKTDVKEIKEAIVGNSQPGLKTEVALTKQSLKRAWWFLSSIAIVILTSAAWIIRAGV